jgi:hypothetical protein
MNRSKNGPRKMTGVKFSAEIQRRIDAIVAELSQRAGGISFTTSTVLSEIAKRGLDVYERELGIKSKSTKAA